MFLIGLRLFVFALARVREGLINNVSSENKGVYYIIVTERKAL